jgi:hypothetical protein
VSRSCCPLQGYASSELVHTGSEVVERNWSSTFLYGWFSKDTWTLLMKTESGATTIETGWLVEPDLMMVTMCEVGTSGNLKVSSFKCGGLHEVGALSWTPFAVTRFLSCLVDCVAGCELESREAGFKRSGATKRECRRPGGDADGVKQSRC